MAEERLWPTNPTPATQDNTEINGLNWSNGLLFKPLVSGYIKGAYVWIPRNPGTTCTLKLYQSTAPLFSGANDTLIASKVMTLGGGTPNWQRFDFDAPVWVQANTVLCIYWHQAPGDNSYGYTNPISRPA